MTATSQYQGALTLTEMEVDMYVQNGRVKLFRCANTRMNPHSRALFAVIVTIFTFHSHLFLFLSPNMFKLVKGS